MGYWLVYRATFWAMCAYDVFGLAVLWIDSATKDTRDPEIVRLFGQRLQDNSATVALAFLGWQILGPLAFAAVLKWRMRPAFVGAKGFLRAYTLSLSAVALAVITAVGVTRPSGRSEAVAPPSISVPPRRPRSDPPQVRPALGATVGHKVLH